MICVTRKTIHFGVHVARHQNLADQHFSSLSYRRVQTIFTSCLVSTNPPRLPTFLLYLFSINKICSPNMLYTNYKTKFKYLVWPTTKIKKDIILGFQTIDWNLLRQEKLQSVSLFPEGNRTYRIHDFDTPSASPAALRGEQTWPTPQKSTNTQSPLESDGGEAKL